MSNFSDDEIRALQKGQLIKLKAKLLESKLELHRLKLLRYKEVLLQLDITQKKLEKEKLKCSKFLEYNLGKDYGTRDD